MAVGLYLYSEDPWINRSIAAKRHRSSDPDHRHIGILKEGLELVVSLTAQAMP